MLWLYNFKLNNVLTQERNNKYIIEIDVLGVKMLKINSQQPTVSRIMDSHIDNTDDTIENMMHDDRILIYDNNDDLEQQTSRGRRKTHLVPSRQHVNKGYKEPKSHSRLDNLMEEVMSD